MAEESTSNRDVSLAKLFAVFLYMGATSWGGGLAAYLREHLVERQKWLDEDHFLSALEIGTTVPGLMATNVSVIVGSRLRGIRGSIAAVMGMTIPGAIAVFILGLLYTRFRKDPEVNAVLNGAAAAAVGLILGVAVQVGRREIKKWRDWAILIPAFFVVGIFHISLVPMLVVLAPIAIQINHPEKSELVAYHSRQAEYHAKLADHHEEVATRHEAAAAASRESGT